MIDDVVFRREMGCTAKDLLRWLPGATRHAPMQIGDGTAVIQAAGGTIRLSFQQAPPRRIGLVTLPVLHADFRFSGVSPAARETFMDYFDLYTKRGGG